jgi:hypothetical protein
MKKDLEIKKTEGVRGSILLTNKQIKMKASKLWKVIVLTFSLFVLFINESEAATECGTCPPDPCTGCPPDETVPLDGGVSLILAGAAALGIRKIHQLKNVKNQI